MRYIVVTIKLPEEQLANLEQLRPRKDGLSEKDYLEMLVKEFLENLLVSGQVSRLQQLAPSPIAEVVIE